MRINLVDPKTDSNYGYSFDLDGDPKRVWKLWNDIISLIENTIEEKN